MWSSGTLLRTHFFYLVQIFFISTCLHPFCRRETIQMPAEELLRGIGPKYQVTEAFSHRDPLPADCLYIIAPEVQHASRKC